MNLKTSKMRTKLVISLLLILLVSCNKDKSDTRKMIGTWKRSLYNGMNGNLIRVDTVHITKNQFTEPDFLTQNNITRPFYLSNSKIYFVGSVDTAEFCYSFANKKKFTINCGYLQGNEFRLTKIK